MRRHVKWLAALAILLAPGLALAASDTVPQGPSAGVSPATPIPDATIGKAGAALRDVANLEEKYQPKMDSATSEKEKENLSAQANAEAVQAIQSHGLSVQEYSTVVRTAQTNPQVKQRLLEAANQR
jgi:hypothetical protein